MNQGKLIVAAEQPGDVLSLAGMKHVRFAAICSWYTDNVELLFTNLVTNTSREGGKKSLTYRRQRLNCQTFTNTHSHIPTSHFRVLYMFF